MQLTAVFRIVPQDYIGFVHGVAGANTQASSLEQARRNLIEAVELCSKLIGVSPKDPSGYRDYKRAVSAT
jgi:predicted RNase H-like HicB family nuclease